MNLKKNYFCEVENRGILKVSGEDRIPFLQGLLTQDMRLLTENRTLYSAFLTPQGRFLHDFFVSLWGEDIYLECERDRIPDLKKRLTLYRLRSKVALEDISQQYKIYALFGKGTLLGLDLPPEVGAAFPRWGGKIYVDPREIHIGARGILPISEAPSDMFQDFEETPFETYDIFRLNLGLPDGSRDMALERAIPLECGLDDLNAIGWDKGCYLGQELTARTKHRGLVRKRYFPVTFEGPAPSFGEKVTLEEQDVGEMLSSCAQQGLIRLRLEAREKSLKTGISLECKGTALTPHVPKWMKQGV